MNSKNINHSKRDTIQITAISYSLLPFMHKAKTQKETPNIDNNMTTVHRPTFYTLFESMKPETKKVKNRKTISQLRIVNVRALFMKSITLSIFLAGQPSSTSISGVLLYKSDFDVGTTELQPFPPKVIDNSIYSNQLASARN